MNDFFEMFEVQKKHHIYSEDEFIQAYYDRVNPLYLLAIGSLLLPEINITIEEFKVKCGDDIGVVAQFLEQKINDRKEDLMITLINDLRAEREVSKLLSKATALINCIKRDCEIGEPDKVYAEMVLSESRTTEELVSNLLTIISKARSNTLISLTQRMLNNILEEFTKVLIRIESGALILSQATSMTDLVSMFKRLKFDVNNLNLSEENKDIAREELVKAYSATSLSLKSKEEEIKEDSQYLSFKIEWDKSVDIPTLQSCTIEGDPLKLAKRFSIEAGNVIRLN